MATCHKAIEKIARSTIGKAKANLLTLYVLNHYDETDFLGCNLKGHGDKMYPNLNMKWLWHIHNTKDLLRCN